MNVLKFAHAQIRSKFYTRIVASLFYYGGFALMIYADWRIALGIFLVLTAMHTTKDME